MVCSAFRAFSWRTLIGNEGVIVTDVDGSTLAFRQNDGALVWQTSGLPANTVVLGSVHLLFAMAKLLLLALGARFRHTLYLTAHWSGLIV